jgi:hypothetical protein
VGSCKKLPGKNEKHKERQKEYKKVHKPMEY